ncbi:NAD(P)/FAD-dependent oxidoreductase [Reyranella sp.]|uniref:NAD(P)/FAD-dependent oxidoreductase n=1 Tax=Reyranella sp. TaxID=1929291 RepID=UPI003D0A2713
MLDQQDTTQDDLRGGCAPWRKGGRPPSRILEDDRRCEVLVVGAGITGAMVAEHLTSLGHEVCLVDRERPGFGSTAASTAMLQWEIDRSLTELTTLYGFERAANIYRQSLHAVTGLKELIETQHLPCEFRPRRSLYLASGAGTGAAELRAEHELRERAGLPGFYLDHPTLLREFGIAREAAILSPGSAEADPMCLAHTLLVTAIRHGAVVYDGEATRFEAIGGGGLAVGLAYGQTIEAQRVILATGYVMPDFVVTDMHRPSSSWAIATPPQKPQVLWPGRPLIWEATTPYFYARTTTDDRIIIGGEDDPALVEPAARDAAMPEKSERILRQLKTLCPEAELRADYCWSGAFSETSDGLPLIGRVRGYPHLYAAYGYGGNGITFSFLAARMIARMIAGEDEPWYTDLAVDRPKP